MLDLQLRPDDLGPEWRADATGWRAGRSYLAPYRHQALEYIALTEGSRSLFVVRERHKGAATQALQPIPAPRRLSPAQYDETRSGLTQWPLDFTLIEITSSDGAADVTITAGVWGTAPLFLIDAQDGLHGSWDPARLYPLLGSSPFDLLLLAQFLFRLDWPYAQSTMFARMKMLTERATARWTSGRGGTARLRIDYPAAAFAPRPKLIKDGADVLGAFENILRGALDRWLGPASTAVTELSGGLDSATVSIVAAELTGHPLRSHGLIMPGETGPPQQQRRMELAERFGFIDFSFPAEENLPLAPGSRRVGAVDIIPWEELYSEAVSRMLAAARPHGGVIFTGMGGDELSTLYPEELAEQPDVPVPDAVIAEQEDAASFFTARAVEAYRSGLAHGDHAPSGPIMTSDLEEAASVSTLYLRNGMWPVSPLATPELIWFCQTLPKEWRRGRVLQREFLAAKGCSRSVTHPQLPETFGPLMDLALRHAARPVLLGLFENSLLADMGLVDRDRLLEVYRRCVDKGGDAYNEPIYATAVMELTIRAVAGQAG